jgi:hypothetical protein
MIDWVVAAAAAALGLWWSEEWVEVGNKGKIKKRNRRPPEAHDDG